MNANLNSETGPINVLFLCTGNSCRSQIAEGWLRELGGNDFIAQSAGIEAHGKNPRAIAIMREAGIDISGQESTIVTSRSGSPQSAHRSWRSSRAASVRFIPSSKQRRASAWQWTR